MIIPFLFKRVFNQDKQWQKVLAILLLKVERRNITRWRGNIDFALFLPREDKIHLSATVLFLFHGRKCFTAIKSTRSIRESLHPGLKLHVRMLLARVAYRLVRILVQCSLTFTKHAFFLGSISAIMKLSFEIFIGWNFLGISQNFQILTAFNNQGTLLNVHGVEPQIHVTLSRECYPKKLIMKYVSNM